jgi:hypothetical protein
MVSRVQTGRADGHGDAEHRARSARARAKLDPLLSEALEDLPPESREAFGSAIATLAGLLPQADANRGPLATVQEQLSAMLLFHAFVLGQMAEQAVSEKLTPDAVKQSLRDRLATIGGKGVATNVRKGASTRERVRAEVEAATARGEDLDAKAIAERLGIGRATAYRHMGGDRG